MKCDYGCGNEANYQLKNKKHCCSKHMQSCPVSRKKNSESHKGRTPNWKNGHPRGMLGVDPHNKGKTYKEAYGEKKSAEIKAKLSNAAKGKNSWSVMSKETRENTKKKISNSIQKRYDNGWMPKSGRCKKISYVTSNGNTVKLDGFWELLVAFYLCLKKVKWTRNKKRFPYLNLDGKTSNYTPDFYLYRENLYVEVKGYENELSKTKKNQFTEKMEVWKKSKIKSIERELDITAGQLRSKFRDSNQISFSDIKEFIGK